MISHENANKLGEFLRADENRAKELISLEPSVAVERINKHGYSFTVSDLTEYGEALRSLVNENGELDLNAMDDVAGGSATAIGGALITGGATIIGNMISSRAW